MEGLSMGFPAIYSLSGEFLEFWAETTLNILKIGLNGLKSVFLTNFQDI